MVRIGLIIMKVSGENSDERKRGREGKRESECFSNVHSHTKIKINFAPTITHSAYCFNLLFHTTGS